MLKIKWIEKVRNEKVLEKTGTKREIWNTIVRRRVKMIGHNLRYPGMLEY